MNLDAHKLVGDSSRAVLVKFLSDRLNVPKALFRLGIWAWVKRVGGRSGAPLSRSRLGHACAMQVTEALYLEAAEGFCHAGLQCQVQCRQ